MLQLTPQQIILLAVKPVDFRKGLDGLAALCQHHLLEDPFSGKLFVFTNRSRRAVKIIVYDGGGFWLCLKRFSKGKLAWWPKSDDQASYALLANELQILLYQGTPQGAQIPAQWRRLHHPTQPLASVAAHSVDNSKEAKPQVF